MSRYSESDFINETTVKNCSNQLFRQLNLQRLEKSKKQNIAKMVYNNMLSIYNSSIRPNINRVNGNTVGKFAKIFNDKAIKDTINDLTKGNQQSPQSREHFGNTNMNHLEYNRSREVGTGGPVKFMDRPQYDVSGRGAPVGGGNSSYMISGVPTNIQKQVGDSRIGQVTSSVDFKPRTMDDIIKQRNMDVPQQHQPGNLDLSLDGQGPYSKRQQQSGNYPGQSGNYPGQQPNNRQQHQPRNNQSELDKQFNTLGGGSSELDQQFGNKIVDES